MHAKETKKMKLNKLTLAVALFTVVALALAGCGDRADVWTEELKILGPYKVGTNAVWVDTTRGMLFVLDGSKSEPGVKWIRVKRNASFVLPSPTGKELLILSAGAEALRKDQTEEKPGLTQVSLDGGAKVKRFYPMTGALNRLVVSKDGRHAVGFNLSSGAAGSGVFSNPNEIAVIDLSKDAASGTNPRMRTLRSFGTSPAGVVISPQMAVPASAKDKRTLAVVLANNQLNLLDLSNPERSEITVPLTTLGTSASVKPMEVLFSTTTGSIFVRATGAQDLYALQLVGKTAASPKQNDFLPIINQPGSGKTTRDMVLVSDGGKDLILTANASKDLSLIEAATSQSSLINLGEEVDTILPLPPKKPTVALIYSRSSPQARVHFLTLKDLSQNLKKNLASRTLNQPVHQVVTSDDGQHAMVVHNSTRTVISVLDMGQHHTISPIQGQVSLGSYDFTKSPYLVGASPNLKQLGMLDLSNLHPRNLRLDHSPGKVLALGDAVLVDHGAPEGRVTLVPHPKAERDACRELWGFMYSGLLDTELSD